jgi:hypothetical protein
VLAEDPKRLFHRQAKRRYRARVRAGIAVALVEYDADAVDFLVRIGSLTDEEAQDRAKVAAALSATVKATVALYRKERGLA